MEGDLNAKLLETNSEEEESLGRKIWTETKKLWIVAGPGIFTRFSTFGITVISQAFIGHIGSTELAAFALVSTVLVRFANGILLGMSSALETLCGQSFGAKQYQMLGVYLQRSWIVELVCTFILLPIFIFTAPLLRLLGQEAEIASVAGTISLWFIPIIFSYIFSFTLQMYLQAQSKNIIIAYLAALTLSLHIFLSWLMAVKLEWGIPGVMLSMILASWIPIIGQMGFVIWGGCPNTWTGFSMLAFKDLCPVIKLSLSSGVMLCYAPSTVILAVWMVRIANNYTICTDEESQLILKCLELWYNTVLVLLTGHMKYAEVAIDALSICLNINGWEMMISVGFLAAASVRVSNELGRGSAKAAKFSVIVVTATSLAIGFVLFIMFLLFRGKISYIFTESEEVSLAVADLSPLLTISILLNSVQPVLSGVAVGAGWQSVVAYVNLTCYYLIGIPIGAILGYAVGFRVKGIWIGMLLGTAFQTLVLMYITWRTDWNKQVANALARVNKWSVPASNDRNGSQPTV